MKNLLDPVRGSAGYVKALSLLTAQAEGSALLDGCGPSQRVHFTYALLTDPALAAVSRSKLILTSDDVRARALADDCALYDRHVFVFPSKDLMFYQADLRSREIETQRIRGLRRLLEGHPVTLIASFAALMSAMVPLRVMRSNVLTLEKRGVVHLEEVAEKLTRMGYERNYQVDAPGQFSMRGDILDIFDLTQNDPVRIELWGDEVESIRSFDVLSQRSIQPLETIRIYPASELILSENRMEDGLRRMREEMEAQADKLDKAHEIEAAGRLRREIGAVMERAGEFGDTRALEPFLQYFYPAADGLLELFDPEKTCVIIDEPEHTLEAAAAVMKEFRENMISRAEKGYILPGQMGQLQDPETVVARLLSYRRLGLSSLGREGVLFAGASQVHLRTRSATAYNSSFASLVEDLKKYRDREWRIAILSASRTRAKRLAGDLGEQGIPAFYSENPARALSKREVMTAPGVCRQGFEYPDLGFAIIAESDIFGAEQTRRHRAKRHEGGERIRSTTDLKVGDYVVHSEYGIGVYKGIEKIEIEQVIKDYIRIEYAAGGVLYVLPTELDVLQKYTGGEDARPKVNKLGTQEWTNTRRKVESAVNVVAEDLVKLYAARQAQKGFAFGKDTVWQREFEELFPYEETADQLTAIEDTKRDMESDKIMDRLICGDVGYGKTEIAIRAAFKAVQDGKQVAVLVPTTILAQQHLNTFRERLHNFPVEIRMLSRFCTQAEMKDTVEALKAGAVDIVIGTHRLLSKDVQFKDLGLLVVDEEQRFGVTHKEKIKKLRENVDVLTLTATPIPRTLHMSLVGIRDMSVLEEAPQDRRPIQTYVLEDDRELEREAILREIARHGQVYVVHNRVNDIAEVAGRLQALIPEARVGYAHGQMSENELEKIMYDFIRRDLDVLVSTTIIETGLDISNANTMIVHDADRLGLAQLYQLRGRIGRSDRTAYAFLLYKRDRILKEEAEKRLTAIREFTELGSGYRIAMRDLEIRGAGSVLGRAQHGHLAAVGYEMYCKLLGDAVKTAKGERPKEERNVRVNLTVDAYLPSTYIVNEVQKLDIYKKISEIRGIDDYEERKAELIDRFGEIPAPAGNLLRIALIRAVAMQLDIREITGDGGLLRIIPEKDADLAVDKIPSLLRRLGKRMSFIARGTPCFEYRYPVSGSTFKDEETLLTSLEEILVVFSEELR